MLRYLSSLMESLKAEKKLRNTIVKTLFFANTNALAVSLYLHTIFAFSFLFPMKRFLIVPLFIASLTPVFAVENTDLVDQVNTLQQQEYSVDDLKFHSFTSCEDMSKTLTDFVKENFVQPQPMPYRRG